MHFFKEDIEMAKTACERCSTSLIVVVVQSLSHGRLFATPWTVTPQAPLSMGFPRQENWSEWSFPSPGDLPNPGIKLASPELTGRFFTTEQPGKPSLIIREMQIETPMRSHLKSVRLTIIKKSTNDKCWRGYGVKEACLHCWWECKLVQLV